MIFIPYIDIYFKLSYDEYRQISLKVLSLEVFMKRIVCIFAGNVLITGTYAFITVPNEIINGGITSFSQL